MSHRSLLPPLGLVSSYFSSLLFYCIAPFRDLSPDAAAWAWGGMVAGLGAWLLWSTERSGSQSLNDSPSVAAGSSSPEEKESKSHDLAAGWEQGSVYIALVGLAVMFFGMAPYLMAGYDPEPAFTSQARVFSSASFGLPILLALLATMWHDKTARMIGSTVAVAGICLMAVFLAGLRGDWQAAAEKRNALCDDLLRQVPDVAPRTTFLFLDLQSYVSRAGVSRAVVFQGVDGLGEFVRMLYGKKDLYGYFLYPKNLPGVPKEGRLAEALPQGLIARGSAVRPPIPLDSLIIFKRDGTKLVLLDRISATDGLAAVSWNGVSSLHSNRGLIRKGPGSRGRLVLSSTGTLVAKTPGSP